MHFPKLTLIVPEKPVSRELDYLHQLFDAGLECLWLRRADHIQLRELVQTIDERYHHRLLLPFDFWKKQNGETAIYGVHCPGYLSESISGSDLLALQKQSTHISTSVHSAFELMNLPPAFTQVMVSPLFDSISKTGYAANAAVWDMPALRPEIRKIGLGGITPDNAFKVLQSGFDGVAVIGSIWQADDPVAKWKAFNDILHNQQTK